MRTAAQPKPSTPRQRWLIHAIALGKKGLGWNKEELADFLDNAYGVRSTLKLSSNEASGAIRNLEAVLQGRGAEIDGALPTERIAKWNAALATESALRTTPPRPANAPSIKALHHVLALLWKLAVKQRARKAVPFAAHIIHCAAGVHRIATAEQCEAVRRALSMRRREQGEPK